MNYDFTQIVSMPAVQHRIQEYVATGDTMPYRVDLDITTDCNYGCPHCGDLARGHLNRGGLSEEIIRSLVADLTRMGVGEVILIGGGEPLVSPLFDLTLELTGATAAAVGLVTNGSKLSSENIHAIARNCAWARVSLDAACEETYYRLHRPRDGATLGTVIDSLARLRTKMTGSLGISFIVMNTNVSEISAATRLAHELGLDSIRFRLMNHPLTDLPIPVRDVTELQYQLREALRLADERFEVSVSETMTGPGTPDSDAYQPKCYTKCAAQAFAPVVSGDGRVYVCSKWRGREWACIGNLNEARFSEVWRSDHRHELVRQLDPSVKCSNVFCHAHAKNDFLARMRAAQGQNADVSHE